MQLSQNSLLAAISNQSNPKWLKELEYVFLPQGHVLARANEPLQFVYFPTTAIVSLCHVTENGNTAAVATIGNEGLAGVIDCLGNQPPKCTKIVQSAGHAYRLLASSLTNELTHTGVTTSLLFRYAQCLIDDMAQNAVCYRHHRLEQQVCTWILNTIDRLPGSDILITHELMGKFIGVRRESITEISLRLQSIDHIQCSRGRIRVLNRSGIEERACECYKSRQYGRHFLQPELEAA